MTCWWIVSLDARTVLVIATQYQTFIHNTSFMILSHEVVIDRLSGYQNLLVSCDGDIVSAWEPHNFTITKYCKSEVSCFFNLTLVVFLTTSILSQTRSAEPTAVDNYLTSSCCCPTSHSMTSNPQPYTFPYKKTKYSLVSSKSCWHYPVLGSHWPDLLSLLTRKYQCSVHCSLIYFLTWTQFVTETYAVYTTI